VTHVQECDFTSLLPTADQVKQADLSEDSVKHLSQVSKSLNATCKPGPAS
jgi:hypothetical protein